jgi:hypothetical protein
MNFKTSKQASVTDSPQSALKRRKPNQKLKVPLPQGDLGRAQQTLKDTFLISAP